MVPYCGSQVFLNIAYGLFIFLVTESRPLLAGGFFKLIACVALACLLAFVVVHSANICKLVIARLHALPRSLFPLAVARRWTDGPQTTIIAPGEPSLSPLFQRPPPFLA
jgi:hypothetical protein